MFSFRQQRQVWDRTLLILKTVGCFEDYKEDCFCFKCQVDANNVVSDKVNDAQVSDLDFCCNIQSFPTSLERRTTTNRRDAWLPGHLQRPVSFLSIRVSVAVNGSGHSMLVRHWTVQTLTVWMTDYMTVNIPTNGSDKVEQVGDGNGSSLTMTSYLCQVSSRFEFFNAKRKENKTFAWFLIMKCWKITIMPTVQ